MWKQESYIKKKYLDASVHGLHVLNWFVKVKVTDCRHTRGISFNKWVPATSV